MKIKNTISLILFVFLFLPVLTYAQSVPQQSKEEKKKAAQLQKAQEKEAKEQQKQREKQAKIDAKIAKNSAPVLLKKEYDRFTDYTTISFSTPTSRQNILEGVKFDLGAAAVYKGTVTPQNENEVKALLVFSYRVDSSAAAANSNLILLVNNKPVDLGQLKTASSKTTTFNSRVTFTDVVLYAELTLDELRILSNAQTIEGRFNGIEFQVSPRFIPTLQQFFKP